MEAGPDDASARPQTKRWRYRLASFARAYGRLREGLAGNVEALTSLEMDGVSRRFGYTFELGWKLLKDRLEHDGAALASVTPRAVVRAAYQARLIDDADAWIDMLADRTRTSHVHDEEILQDVLQEIQSRYLNAFGQLHEQSLQASRSLRTYPEL